MCKFIIETEKAPKAIGPYSQAVVHNGLLYTSGIIPCCPYTNEIVSSEFEKQVIQVFENAKALLDEANANVKDVLKVTVFLSDMNNFSNFNDLYGKFFKAPYPARSCVEVSRLPKDVLIELEMISMAREIIEMD